MPVAANLVPSAHTRPASPAGRVARGVQAHAAGHHAEAIVARHYASEGAELLERCWRGPAGEIDLILQEGEVTVFVEVKHAARIDLAAHRLNARQMERICLSASAYCERLPGGAFTAMRFDAALVDAAGHVEIVRNAFGWN